MNTHIYILLDRSGSMESIASDIIGGFNTFLAEQRAAGPDARLTLVQFDSQDTEDLILEGAPIAETPPLDHTRFKPRGRTPLLDATAKLIQRARLSAELRSENSLPGEHIVFVSITDGEENASREHGLAEVRKLIAECEVAGWTFVFLSAALDAYGDARRMGIDDDNIQGFGRSKASIDNVFASCSYRISELRADTRDGRPSDKQKGFFGGTKPAEQELQDTPGATPGQGYDPDQPQVSPLDNTNTMPERRLRTTISSWRHRLADRLGRIW